LLQIGDTLREARRRRGLDLHACEAGTKIRAKYLVALEEEQFEILPEPAYVRGFLRTYADFLELDPRPLLEEYGDRIAPDSVGLAAEHEVRSPTAEAAAGPGEPRRPMLLPTLPPRPDRRLVLLAVGALAVLAVLLWLGLGGGGGSQEAQLPSLPPATRPVHHAPPDAARAHVAAPRAASSAVRLVLAGTEGTNGSYVNLHLGNQTGPLIYEGTITAGQKRSWHARGPLWMRVGWTPNLVVRLNGRTVTITGGTADFTVRPRGVAPAT
jgi:hypothetical protein